MVLIILAIDAVAVLGTARRGPVIICGALV